MTTSSPPARIRWKLALAALPVVLLLAGCRQTASYTIHADDTMTVELDLGMTAEEAAGFEQFGTEDVPSSGQDVCDVLKSSTEGGLAHLDKLTPYDDRGGMYGCVAKGTGPLDDSVVTRDGDTFIFKLDGSAEDADLDGVGTDGEYSVTVTFPGKVLSHKGGTVKGNSVVWSGESQVSSKMEATGSASGGMNLMLILLIVGGVVIVLAAVAIIIVVTRKSKKKTPPGSGYPGQPGQYPQQGQPQYPGQPGQYPQQGQPQYPGQPGQYPQQGQQGQYPQQGQPQQFPQQGQQPQAPQQFPGQQFPQQGQQPQQGQPQFPGQQFPQQDQQPQQGQQPQQFPQQGQQPQQGQPQYPGQPGQQPQQGQPQYPGQPGQQPQQGQLQQFPQQGQQPQAPQQ